MAFPTHQRVLIANGGYLNASQWGRKSQKYPINSWCIFLKIFVDKVPYIFNNLEKNHTKLCKLRGTTVRYTFTTCLNYSSFRDIIIMPHPYDQALITACENGHHNLIKPLVTAGASVNTSESDSDSELDDRDEPLMVAVKNRHVKCIKTLISLGADINTTLGMVVRKGKFWDIEPLLDSGADVNHLDKYGCSILMSAASKGHVRCINCVIILQKAGMFAKVPLHRSIGSHNSCFRFLKEKRPWIK